MVYPSFFQPGAALNFYEWKCFEECKLVSVRQLLIYAVFPGKIRLKVGVMIDGVPRVSLPYSTVIIQFVSEGRTKNKLIDICYVFSHMRIDFRVAVKGDLERTGK